MHSPIIKILLSIINQYGGRSVGIVRSRTQTMEFVLFFLWIVLFEAYVSSNQSSSNVHKQ
jgi:hypothetical protein